MKQGAMFATAFARVYAVYHAAMVLAFCYLVSSRAYSTAELVGFTVTAGLLGGAAFNVGHELIHRHTPIDDALARMLLCVVSYPTFQIEHIGHHHKWVATDRDPSSAKAGVSLYVHIPRAIVLNLFNAGRVAYRRSQSFGWNNELVRAMLCQLTLYAFIALVFHARATLFFFAQSLIAIVWLEIANYFQHYGLRRKIVDGRPERVSSEHSWDVDQPFLNKIWLNLPLHSNHHIDPSTPFDRLEQGSASPKYPFGYVSCTFLAMIPPLWTWFVAKLISAQRDRS
jgi:alkane 1-monooxygenase